MGREFWVFGWVLCWITGTAVGARKGEPLGGFLFTFLLGPLGLILVVTESPDSYRTKTCPQCPEAVHAEALVCWFCGWTFQDHGVARQGAATAPAPIAASSQPLVASTGAVPPPFRGSVAAAPGWKAGPPRSR